MRVAIRTSHADRLKQVEYALATDQTIEVVAPDDRAQHIALIDANLIPKSSCDWREFDGNAQIIVVFAPTDPDRLASYLAAGARGYHCQGESWQRLLSVLHMVFEGGLRTNPQVMDQLLRRYRAMQRLLALRWPNTERSA